jgi:hypothetical protein
MLIRKSTAVFEYDIHWLEAWSFNDVDNWIGSENNNHGHLIRLPG